MRNYSNFVDAFVDYASTSAGSPIYYRWTALSILAGALERKVWFNFNSEYHIYMNMYVFIIGPSGLARKSTSTFKGIELLMQVEGVVQLAQQMSEASLIVQLERAGKEKLVNIDGKEYRHCSSFLYGSEAINTLGDLNRGNLKHFLTDIYDSGGSGWHEKATWSKETKTDGASKLVNPCLNMLMCSTPEWLLEDNTMTKEDLRAGYGARCFFVIDNDLAGDEIELVEELNPQALDNKIKHTKYKAKLVEDLTQVHGLAGEFTYTTEFARRLNAFKKTYSKFIKEMQGDMFVGFFSRRANYTIKLACLYAIAENNDLVVNEKHWDRAHEDMEELVKNMYGAFGTDQPIMNFWNAIRNIRGHFARGSITKRIFRDGYTESEVSKYITQLHHLGKIEYAVMEGNTVKYLIKDDSPL